jgi:hypothetical protein
MFFVSDLLSYSQAGRRGFDPRPPLHPFNSLHEIGLHPVLRLCSVYDRCRSKTLETHSYLTHSVLRLTIATRHSRSPFSIRQLHVAVRLMTASCFGTLDRSNGVDSTRQKKMR